MTQDELLFFSKAPGVLPAYEKLAQSILAAWPETEVTVQKSQIAFSCKRRFAFASLRGKRLIVTFGLGERVDEPRIDQAVEPYPGRWTHHVVVQATEDIDEELMAWIAQAKAFAARK